MVKLSVKLVTALFIVIIVLIIIFTILGDTSNEVGSAAGNMTCINTSDPGCLQANATGNVAVSDVFPLTSFFKKKGVILLAFIAGIVIVIITGLLTLGKKK